jgi:hypothetical protein
MGTGWCVCVEMYAVYGHVHCVSRSTKCSRVCASAVLHGALCTPAGGLVELTACRSGCGVLLVLTMCCQTWGCCNASSAFPCTACRQQGAPVLAASPCPTRLQHFVCQAPLKHVPRPGREWWEVGHVLAAEQMGVAQCTDWDVESTVLCGAAMSDCHTMYSIPHHHVMA